MWLLCADCLDNTSQSSSHEGGPSRESLGGRIAFCSIYPKGFLFVAYALGDFQLRGSSVFFSLLVVQELGQLWEKCSEDCNWQAVFCALGLQDEIPTSVKEVYLRSMAVLNMPGGQGKPPSGGTPPSGDKPASEGPETPKNAPKNGKKNKHDDMTPEKPGSARRRVQRVDSCRPAPFGKPQEVEQKLKRVQKNGKRVNKSSEKPDEEEQKDPDADLEIDDDAASEDFVCSKNPPGMCC